MLPLSKTERIAKILKVILVIIFVIAISFLWVKIGHYHFDDNSEHLHVDMHNKIHSF